MICSQTLHLRDLQDEFLGLLVTHMPDTIPEKWNGVSDLVSVLYQGEFFVDDSERPGYNFCAIHYHSYNRYSENVSPDSSFSDCASDMDIRELEHQLGYIQITLKGQMWSEGIMDSVFPENRKRSREIQRSSFSPLGLFNLSRSS
jgi:hypothetical protein